MSDYLFQLESHLGPELLRVLQTTEAAGASVAGHLFLTGGALRDTLCGSPVTTLEFTVEGNPAKLVKDVAATLKAKTSDSPSSRKATRLELASGQTFEIGMAQQATYSKPAANPQIKPASIHDDLRGRDFTLNAIALSLNSASRGLLLDPVNGLGDIGHREIRATYNYTLYDEPARILRMLRLKTRLGFEIAERTQMQYENVREAKLEEKIPAKSLYTELRAMASEPDPGALLALLEQERLLTLFSPTLVGAKINQAGFAKLHKLRQMLPYGAGIEVENVGLFLFVLTELFNPKEKAALIKQLGIPSSDVALWQKLDQRSKKLESTLKSAKLNRASLIYQTLRSAAGDQVLYLLYHSNQRLVQDRIKKHLTSYVPGVMEILDREVTAHSGIEPGAPKFAKAKEDYINGRLDGRIRKPAPVEEPPPMPAGPGRRGRPPSNK
jgi:tRNA nucleotidyltransferase/poly(A) polymerase